MSDSKSDPNVQPFDNAFMQLKLKAVTPKHSPQLVVACTFLVAVIFIPVGVAIILANDRIWEQEIRYDNVKDGGCSVSNNDNITFQDGVGQGCRVRLSFSIDKEIAAPIYIYYRIKGMHQNYRGYVDSTSYDQMKGEDPSLEAMENCMPFLQPGQNGAVSQATTDGAPTSAYVYSPCGSIAWSMFNDTFALYRNPNSETITNTAANLPASVSAQPVCIGGNFGIDGTNNNAGSCTKNGIALSIDKDSRFQAPFTNAKTWTRDGKTGSDNPYLANGFYDGEPGHRIPSSTDEDFMVWARVAALPDFRKLYRRIDTSLTVGQYVWDIEEFYPTAGFQGEKSIILATTSWVGGKNTVLGVLFLAFGCLSFVLAIVFFIIGTVKEPSRGADTKQA